MAKVGEIERAERLLAMGVEGEADPLKERVVVVVKMLEVFAGGTA